METKTFASFISVVAALALVPVAQAQHRQPQGDLSYPSLDAAASAIAHRPVSVRCPVDRSSWNSDPQSAGVMAYTWLDTDWTRLNPDQCDFLVSFAAGRWPRYEDSTYATAILVLTHESFHLRHWYYRGCEARVEQQALGHWQVVARMLGADPVELAALAPWVRYADYQMTRYAGYATTRRATPSSAHPRRFYSLLLRHRPGRSS